jgi:hypothetical protein
MFKKTSREGLDRIAWRIIDQQFQYPLESAGLAKNARPKSFPEFEMQLRIGIDFECALSMFLQEFYSHRDPCFFAEPPSAQLSAMKRAALAGAAEWLCHRFGYDVPAWTEEPEFFLKSERNWFDEWDTSDEDGAILAEVFDPEFIASIREESVKKSAQEFLRRNLLFPVRGLIRI